MGRPQKYTTEEERLAARRERARLWRKNNHELANSHARKWSQANLEKRKEAYRANLEYNREAARLRRLKSKN